MKKISLAIAMVATLLALSPVAAYADHKSPYHAKVFSTQKNRPVQKPVFTPTCAQSAKPLCSR